MIDYLNKKNWVVTISYKTDYYYDHCKKKQYNLAILHTGSADLRNKLYFENYLDSIYIIYD